MKNSYIEKDGVVSIMVLHKGKEFECLVDLPDFYDLCLFRTVYISTCETKHSGSLHYCYIYNTPKKKRESVHRFILGVEDSKIIVDHINGNPLDNRRSNLRIGNVQQNAENLHIVRTATRHINITETKFGTYVAMFQHKGKYVYLGTWKTLRDANVATITARKYLKSFSLEARGELYEKYVH